MIDPDELQAYEDWRERKLHGELDLSAQAFNVEMEATALAWEAGVRAAFNTAEPMAIVIEQNPYRKSGTTGFRKPSGPGIGDGPGGQGDEDDDSPRRITS